MMALLRNLRSTGTFISGRDLDVALAFRRRRAGKDGCELKMARSKADVEAERELAVGLVVGCALDVRKSNTTDLIEGISGLEKLLAAVQQLAKVFGWPDDGHDGDEAAAKGDDTRH